MIVTSLQGQSLRQAKCFLTSSARLISARERSLRASSATVSCLSLNVCWKYPIKLSSVPNRSFHRVYY